MPHRRSRSDGQRSRELILEAAARVATVDGLHGLSLAQLAEMTGMSKSGVFGLFGSKEELQLATIDQARSVFVAQVVDPALTVPSGRDRLVALCDGYLDHVARRVFPGGCFFASVAAEVATRPGPVRDHVARQQREWVQLLRDNIEQAARRGELPATVDVTALSIELSTMLTGADIAFLLHEDPGILHRVRTAIRRRLDAGGGHRSGAPAAG